MFGPGFTTCRIQNGLTPMVGRRAAERPSLHAGAPAEIFPRGEKALPKHPYILHISVCVGLLYIVHCYVLCVLEAGILGLHIFVRKLKRNITQ